MSNAIQSSPAAGLRTDEPHRQRLARALMVVERWGHLIGRAEGPPRWEAMSHEDAGRHFLQITALATDGTAAALVAGTVVASNAPDLQEQARTLIALAAAPADVLELLSLLRNAEAEQLRLRDELARSEFALRSMIGPRPSAADA